ncbi:hypothetical protein [Flavobacterium sp. K5-23]|uniref:hypothetical protein n=1 Tax=Flavobacterium sp. K5-23 TaxID=2746225 RepID=UPI00200C2432|nr:hypothetical protein [Flavobacterium sp. K5-23]UQD56679.1 hypothetical protein FLAK523_09880 [Flavobacterium sp. K5-23]
MKATKKLGIWMDHSIAYLMEFTSNKFVINTIESKFILNENGQNLIWPENFIRTIDQQLLITYYNKISEIIKDYKLVILFGPNNAKIELFDVLSEDERFVKIKVEFKNTEKMNENQKYDFVKLYKST